MVTPTRLRRGGHVVTSRIAHRSSERSAGLVSLGSTAALKARDVQRMAAGPTAGAVPTVLPGAEPTVAVSPMVRLSVARMSAALSRVIGDDAAAPRWNAGDFFGTRFGGGDASPR